QGLPALDRRGIQSPVELEPATRVLLQVVFEQLALAVLPLGRLQPADNRLGRLEAVAAQVAPHRLELGADLGDVPLASGGLLAGFRLTPDEDQPVVEPDALPIDRALRVLGDLQGPGRVALLGRELGLALREIIDAMQAVAHLKVPPLELRREDPAAEELPPASGDREQVLRGIELGVGDVEQSPVGQDLAQPLEVLEVRVDPRGVAVQGEMADRHAAITGDVQAELDLLDVLTAALGAAVGGHGEWSPGPRPAGN